MLESAVAQIVSALQNAGVPAQAAYEPLPLDRSRALVAVGIGEAALGPGGFGDDEGLRCDATLSLTIYAPLGEENAAALCQRTFDRAAFALLGLGSALRPTAFRCGEAATDSESGMLRCKGSASARLRLTAESASEESGEFLDFILKGVIQA